MIEPLYDWHCHGCGHVQTRPRSPAPRSCISGLCEGTSFRGHPIREDKPPVDPDRQRQELALRLNSPKRAPANKRPAEQANELDTPLFGRASSPTML